jgi:hypothetical protein
MHRQSYGSTWEKISLLPGYLLLVLVLGSIAWDAVSIFIVPLGVGPDWLNQVLVGMLLLIIAIAMPFCLYWLVTSLFHRRASS